MRKPAFTLIELLVVVAIIGILVAIALPQFQLARIRANVGRVQGDQQAYKTAYETYRSDNGEYMNTDVLPLGLLRDPIENRWVGLTTPIPYIAMIPVDVFGDDVESSNPRNVDGDGNYMYKTFDFVSGNEPLGDRTVRRRYRDHDAFLLALRKKGKLLGAEAIPPTLLYYFTSQGPDQLVGTKGGDAFEPVLYDPSNGVRSAGDIFKFGPG